MQKILKAITRAEKMTEKWWWYFGIVTEGVFDGWRTRYLKKSLKLKKKYYLSDFDR